MQHRQIAPLVSTLSTVSGLDYWVQLAAVEMTIAEMDPTTLVAEMDDIVRLIDPTTLGERLVMRAAADQTHLGSERRTAWDMYVSRSSQTVAA